jgi:hypothetical protein
VLAQVRRIDGTGDLPLRWLRSRWPLQLIGTILSYNSFCASHSGGVLLVGSSLGLGTEVGGGTGLAEEAADHRLEERVEDDLGTAGWG